MFLPVSANVPPLCDHDLTWSWIVQNVVGRLRGKIAGGGARIWWLMRCVCMIAASS